MAGYTGEETIEEYESRQRKEKTMKEKKKKDVTFLDDVEPRKEPESSKGELIPFEGNLPTGVTVEDFNRMLKEDLHHTIEGVIPRLLQIKILHAGTLMFQMPSDEVGKTQNVEFFEGIIIDQHPCNAYWEQSFADSGGGAPPDCVSPDGKIGTKYGDCHACPKNQPGSGNGGKGFARACKNMKRLHVLMDGHTLPFRLTLPPTSITEADRFLGALADRLIPMTIVRVRFSLADAVSSGNIHYSQIRFEVIEKTTERYMEIKNFLEEHKAQIREQAVLAEEYVNDPTDFKPEEMER